MFIINGYDRKANACSPWTSCVNTEVNLGHSFDNVSHKVHALARLTLKYIRFSKTRLLLNVFSKSQFLICCLIWIWHSRTLNEKITLHERCLRIIYNDKTVDISRNSRLITIYFNTQLQYSSARNWSFGSPQTYLQVFSKQ